MTSYEMPNDLTKLQELFDHYWNRLTAIEKNKGTDLFCSSCFEACGDLDQCPRCGGDTVSRLIAFDSCHQVAQNYGHELRRIKSSRFLSQDSGEEPEDSRITVILGDGQELTFSDDRRARKALRDRGLSVTQAVKNGSTWTIS